MNSSNSEPPLNFGDIYIVAFPLTNGTEAKTRPAVAVASEDWRSPDALVIFASVSGSAARASDKGAVVVENWADVGLDRPSVVQTHRLFSSQLRYAGKKLGRLHAVDRESLKSAISDLFAN
ncbi:type II toxin-antitoxin system PemK/MazF family toxin [Salinibacterium sp. SWN167]|uniref:type II toxin-antitoxin system PemK/MazF family toxin n=1 Tax=Salinibacterium sp. SWN167 TaxID=2792054 RepID=UPI0018CDE5F1|nr:type II toxin-antitoxin system PemK/MazF family toxin [Salinibacterium sp. SWN167]